MFEVISILWGNFVELTEPIWKPMAALLKQKPKPKPVEKKVETGYFEPNDVPTIDKGYEISALNDDSLVKLHAPGPYDFLEEGKDYKPENFTFSTHHYMMDIFDSRYDILYTKPTAEDFVRMFNTRRWYIKDSQPHSLFVDEGYNYTSEVHANIFVIDKEGFRFSDEKEFNKVCKFIEDITERNIIPNNVDDQRHRLITRDRPIFKD